MGARLGILPGMNAVFAPTPKPAALATQRFVNLVVLHCSATPSGRWLAGPRGAPGFREAADVIDGWHAARGFRRTDAAIGRYMHIRPHIGYHFVVDVDGTIEGGRSLKEVGAHVQGYNSASVGVCLVGGAERDARYTAPQWEAAAALVRELCKRLAVPQTFPLYPRRGGGVCGHRDLSPDTDGDGRIRPHEWLKTCPGFDVSAWLARGLVPLPEQVCESTERGPA